MSDSESSSAAFGNHAPVCANPGGCLRNAVDLVIDTVAGTEKYVCAEHAKCAVCGHGYGTKTTAAEYIRTVVNGQQVTVANTKKDYSLAHYVPGLATYLHVNCSAQCTRCYKTAVRWLSPWNQEVRGSRLEDGKICCASCLTKCTCGVMGCQGPQMHKFCSECKQRTDGVAADKVALIQRSDMTTTLMHVACIKCSICDKRPAQNKWSAQMNFRIGLDGKVAHTTCMLCYVCKQRTRGDGAKWSTVLSDGPEFNAVMHTVCRAQLRDSRKRKRSSGSSGEKKRGKQEE